MQSKSTIEPNAVQVRWLTQEGMEIEACVANHSAAVSLVLQLVKAANQSVWVHVAGACVANWVRSAESNGTRWIQQ